MSNPRTTLRLAPTPAPRSRVLAPAFFALSAALLSACGGELPSEPTFVTDNPITGPAGGDQPAGGDAPKSGDGIVQPGTGGQGGDQVDPGGGGPGVDNGAALAEALTQCGGLAAGGTVTADAALTGLPVTRKGTSTLLGLPVGQWTLTLVPSAAWHMSDQTASTGLTAQSSVDPQGQTSTAQPIINSFNGTTTHTLVPIPARAAFAQSAPALAHVVCAVQPTSRTTAQFGQQTVVADYAPPLPAMLWPRAAPERFTAEIGGGLTVTGIVATVAQSNVAGVAAGSRLTGSVTITPIAPTAQVARPDGTTVTVGGNLAFEVRTDFGSPAVTSALGLAPIARYFLDTDAHALKAVVTESGVAGEAAVVYVTAP
jgi:hypothetical protein